MLVLLSYLWKNGIESEAAAKLSFARGKPVMMKIFENSGHVDLRGKICPYPVVQIIETVDNMDAGDGMIFLVDDPLAVKSVPEELEEMDDFGNIVLHIEKCTGFWKIMIARKQEGETD